ncbi:MAG: tRNA (adenosine(37)-N6)-dimethylallyltransferase MiaA [Chitinophagaceae bacterium]
MSDTSSKTAWLILGPTASGKTAASIHLARQLKTSIISADSRQCYREMTIGVAKPTTEELAAVHHDFINTHSIHETVDAKIFELEALTAAERIFEHHDHVVVSGGTGLYAKVLCEGIDELPDVDEGVRAEVRGQKRSVTELKQWLEKIDPDYLQQTSEGENPSRLMRAIEVKLSSGHSILDFRTGKKKQRPFAIRKYGIEWPREVLYARINQRVDEMFEAGLVEEATHLYAHKHLPALQTVGYQEIFDYIDGKYSLETAREKIKQHTRNYAKRQMTWFRKDPEIMWTTLESLKLEV